MTTLYWTLAILGTIAIIGFIIASYIFHTIEDEEEYESECYDDKNGL